MFLNVSCYYLIPGSLKPEATENFVSPIKSIQEKITTVSEKAYIMIMSNAPLLNWSLPPQMSHDRQLINENGF